MSEKPTPETAPLMHAAANESIEAMFRMGCDLERKLAEVTKQRDAAFEWRKEQFGLAIKQRDEAMEELAEMTAQRDEALEELAEVTKQRDQLADLLEKAKIYVHTCPLQAQIIAALSAKKGGGR